MEIVIKVPNGIDNDIVRIVKENANALNFDHAEFEDEWARSNAQIQKDQDTRYCCYRLIAGWAHQFLVLTPITLKVTS